MGIKAEQLGVNMEGSTAEVTKTMASNPRRISKIEVHIQLPFQADDKSKKILENIANTCPVHYSLHPDIEKIVEFHWK